MIEKTIYYENLFDRYMRSTLFFRPQPKYFDGDLKPEYTYSFSNCVTIERLEITCHLDDNFSMIFETCFKENGRKLDNEEITREEKHLQKIFLKVKDNALEHL